MENQGGRQKAKVRIGRLGNYVVGKTLHKCVHMRLDCSRLSLFPSVQNTVSLHLGNYFTERLGSAPIKHGTQQLAMQ